MSIQKGTVLITGTSNGFGRATAQAFLDDGWRTFATLRDAAGRNAAAAAELRDRGAEVLELDVTSDASVDAAARIVAERAGALDVLVNNAGNVYAGLVEAHTPQSVAAQFETNTFGPLRVNRAFLPAMRERRKGLVVYVSSVVGRLVFPFFGVYGASKFALEALAESAAYELRPFGVDVAIVEPGAYATNIFSVIAQPDDQARIASYGDAAKIGEQLSAGLGASAEGKQPAEIAGTILALANAPAGQRPLRTVIGYDPRVDEINAETGSRQRAILSEYGLGALLAPEPAIV
jgi:NAD(P)-dependent dehydrogenase (short-subunit alcohol dehydrogenase family)